jgi:2-polyprenyl-6-methoxyphenol hydroxylase-like FAD-dependent oxidoreductase
LHAGEETRAFSLFEALRRKRASSVQAQSLHQGRLYHMAPPLSWARNAGLRALPGPWLMAAYDRLYGWQPGPEHAHR